jgi:hypothetical protein
VKAYLTPVKKRNEGLSTLQISNHRYYFQCAPEMLTLVSVQCEKIAASHGDNLHLN